MARMRMYEVFVPGTEYCVWLKAESPKEAVRTVRYMSEEYRDLNWDWKLKN